MRQGRRKEATCVMVKGRSLLDGCSPALVCADAQAAMRARNQATIWSCFIQKFFLYGSGDREIAVQSVVVVLSSGYRAELGGRASFNT